MADNFANNRTIKAKRLALVNRHKSRPEYDPSTRGAPYDPQAYNRKNKAFFRAASQGFQYPKRDSMVWDPNPTRTINKKTKVQHGTANL